MSDINFILAVALGVAIAVVYPTLYRYIRKQFPPQAGIFPSWLKSALMKYGALFAFSVVTAVILVGTYRTANPDTTIAFWAAMALGFGFEASIEKLIFPKSETGSQPSSAADSPVRPVLPM